MYRVSTNPPTLLTDDSLFLFISKFESLEREMQGLRRAQEEMKTLLQKMNDGLGEFISSVTIADQQPGETPREASREVA